VIFSNERALGNEDRKTGSLRWRVLPALKQEGNKAKMKSAIGQQSKKAKGG